MELIDVVASGFIAFSLVSLAATIFLRKNQKIYCTWSIGAALMGIFLIMVRVSYTH